MDELVRQRVVELKAAAEQAKVANEEKIRKQQIERQALEAIAKEDPSLLLPYFQHKGHNSIACYSMSHIRGDTFVLCCVAEHLYTVEQKKRQEILDAEKKAEKEAAEKVRLAEVTAVEAERKRIADIERMERYAARQIEIEKEYYEKYKKNDWRNLTRERINKYAYEELIQKGISALCPMCNTLMKLEFVKVMAISDGGQGNYSCPPCQVPTDTCIVNGLLCQHGDIQNRNSPPHCLYKIDLVSNQHYKGLVGWPTPGGFGSQFAKVMWAKYNPEDPDGKIAQRQKIEDEINQLKAKLQSIN